ncbi:MAG: hypothetical protein RIM84_17800 [Alphaproteobacteria bacterium]
MSPTHRLALVEDELPPGFALDLPAATRALYVVAGAIQCNDATVAADNGCIATDKLAIAAPNGARLWRFELLTAGALAEPPGSRGLLAADLETAPAGDWLLRLDSVAFPVGGCAFAHVHQGPGIRCLLHGEIRIDSEGRSTHYQPGQAWFEAGPEPVFAQASAKWPSRFIRAMVLPRDLLGKSSISYVDPADKDKPKSQTYRVFADTAVERPA